MHYDQVLLDTDILSAIMRKNPTVSQFLPPYLIEHKKITISIITRYEILRGLKAKGAVKQCNAFDLFCKECEILPITDEVVIKASDIYAALSNHGKLISDADILIAASAMVNGLGVVTNNESHFKRIDELHVMNWLR